MRIVHAASEVVGFAKTGGLADVAGALPRALAERGHDVLIVAPLYRSVRHGKTPVQPTEHGLSVPVGPRWVQGRLWQATLPDSSVPVILIEHGDYFERDDPAYGRGLYHYTLPGGGRRDYPDNCARFCFFNRAILEVLRILDFWPQVLHNHDWQTGMAPVFLQEVYRRFAPPGLRERYEGVRTVFTIHNIAYQGCYRPPEFPLTGLDWRLFNHRQLEFYGQLCFLKAGVMFSDWLTTVSPTYAREIQTPEFGYGMQGVIAERQQRLTGIVNGADYREWDPAADPHLPANFSVDAIDPGKPACKAALQKRYGLAEEPRLPLLAMVARLVDQKGVDLVIKTADAFLRGGNGGSQFILLGDGDPVYHRLLSELRDRHPDRVGLTLGFDEPLAHQIEAGADIYLMPSRYEPSGLNQLYSLRYGTIPVVRATGGLADTIVDFNAETLANGTATGFRFVPYTPTAFLTAVQRAVNLYRHEPDQWRLLQQNAMRQDWSWQRSAAEYEKVYEKVVGGSDKMTS